MTEKQEAEWLYAQGLEIAIMLKGPIKKKITEGSVIKLIEEEYDAIAGRIAGELLNKANKMVKNNMI